MCACACAASLNNSRVKPRFLLYRQWRTVGRSALCSQRSITIRSHNTRTAHMDGHILHAIWNEWITERSNTLGTERCPPYRFDEMASIIIYMYRGESRRAFRNRIRTFRVLKCVFIFTLCIFLHNHSLALIYLSNKRFSLAGRMTTHTHTAKLVNIVFYLFGRFSFSALLFVHLLAIFIQRERTNEK